MKPQMPAGKRRENSKISRALTRFDLRFLFSNFLFVGKLPFNQREIVQPRSGLPQPD
jgi:hypothetical protein